MKQALSVMAAWLAAVYLVGTSVQPAAAATTAIPFAAFGYRDTIFERGSSGALSIFVPIVPGLREVRLHAPLTISPQVDPRSSMVVTVNDVPVTSIAVRTAGRNPTLDLSIPVPGGAKSMAIAIVGRLFVLGDVCTDPRLDDLWFTVARESRLTVITQDRSSHDQVGDFLNQYGGTFAVAGAQTDDATRAAAIQLAYRLHQIERWRRVDVRLAATPDDARRVVIGHFPTDIAVRGRELDVTPRGVALIDERIDRMLIAPSVHDARFTPDAATNRELPLTQLGIANQTLRGSGELPFDVPLTYAAFGGVPEHLRLHVDLAHTPIHKADRAFVQVLVNNTLIGSYDMSGANNLERFDVPLDVDAISSSNVVRIVPTFYYERDGCKGNYPSFTATLGSDTKFAWDGLQRRTLSVGEFVRAASGKVVVLVEDRAQDAGAFALVNTLGTINSAVHSIDVRPFEGTVPSGYDYAIVVSAGARLGALAPPLQVNGQDFTIFAADGRTERYHANYSEPFGVLETTYANSTPTLIATYWKDPHVLADIARLQADDLGTQTDNVMIFNTREATYTDTSRRPAPRGDDSLALKIPAIIGLFALLLVGVVLVASRRKL